MEYDDLKAIQDWTEQQIRALETTQGLSLTPNPNIDTIIKLQQLRLQAYNSTTLDCIFGVLLETKEQQEEDHSKGEGIAAFNTTIAHGMELFAHYLDSYKGQHEMEGMSEELKDILSHFHTAALLWVNDFQVEEDEEGEEAHG